MDSLGIYVSVPFCRAKCSFCNFASGVWGEQQMHGYMQRVAAEAQAAHGYAEGLGLPMPARVDSLYFGGGTPSLLPGELVGAFFQVLGRHFQVEPGAEVTLEGAPGQLEPEGLAAWQRAGVNRVSLGVQSFIDRESAAVGRQHTGQMCREEIRRLRRAGVEQVGVDLICGLPHQNQESWRVSVEEALASGADHVSVYMLEVDEGSRLGREALAGGIRYGADALPGDDAVAEWYGMACEWLAAGGWPQYEISNFGRPSRHNTRYWRREPYLGFGLDAHSMLRSGTQGIRWANPDEMGEYLGTNLAARGWPRALDRVDTVAAFEESLFLGLRMNRGVSLSELRHQFGGLVDGMELGEMTEAGLLQQEGDCLYLTAKGRMASNEVFGRLLVGAAA